MYSVWLYTGLYSKPNTIGATLITMGAKQELPAQRRGAPMV